MAGPGDNDDGAAALALRIAGIVLLATGSAPLLVSGEVRQTPAGRGVARLK